jgi:hypothetical protein
MLSQVSSTKIITCNKERFFVAGRMPVEFSMEAVNEMPGAIGAVSV